MEAKNVFLKNYVACLEMSHLKEGINRIEMCFLLTWPLVSPLSSSIFEALSMHRGREVLIIIIFTKINKRMP